MKLVSIIVPIYNAQNYLSRCLDSLLAQTLEDIEIILINDGSTDDSLDICKAYEAKDPRIVLIDQANGGVSAARNAGINRASGEYIGFVDPDDWIEPWMYALMYNKARTLDCPICFCNYYKDDKNSSIPKRFKIKQETLNREEIIEMIVSNMVGVDDIMPNYNFVMGCVWRGLYSRAFIEAHHISFEVGVGIMEDLVFNVQALLKADQICIVPEFLYHYVQNPKSVLHTYNKNMWPDQVRVHALLEQYIQEAGLEDMMRNRLDMRYVGMAFSAIYNEVNRKSKSGVKYKVSKVKEICADEKLKLSLERIRPIRGSGYPKLALEGRKKGALQVKNAPSRFRVRRKSKRK